MGDLKDYEKKRDFSKTPEPKAKKATDSGLTFVIQKHNARNLHYDLRLKVGGALKSWTLPKGPTTDPTEKRLARMVEDHPVSYEEFEGVIPEGNYGAGTVMVWDKGVYGAEKKDNPKQIEDYIIKGLEKGHFSFIMKGEKLKGAFTLARLKDPENWILIKKVDEFAGLLLDNDEKSAKTGRTMEEIAEEAEKTGSFWSSQKEKAELKDIPLEKLPKGVKPMLATLTKEPFKDKDWIFEIKWDGYRGLYEKEKGKANLYSRNLKSFNSHFPSLLNSLESLAEDLVLDGEIVSLGEDGMPMFQDLQNYNNLGQGQLVYYVFDLLHYDGHNLRDLPLLERKEILKKILPDLPNVRYSEHFDEDGISFFKAAKEQGLEGIVGKKKDSLYRTGKRSQDWLKIKSKLTQEAVMVGFTKPKGSRGYFGSLLLAVYEDKKLIYIGSTGTGFDEKRLKDLYERLIKLKTVKSPLLKPPNLPDITWVRPELVALITFQEWTKEGHTRQSVFLGLREDLDPKSVIREKPKNEG